MERTNGRIAFEAYNAQRGGLTYDGKPIPGWDEVPEGIRTAWEFAAGSVLAANPPDRTDYGLDRYQNEAARTLPPNEGLPEGIVLAALGLAGEAGEFVELVKKHRFQGAELDPTKVQKELGDVLWYMAAACTVLGLHLSDVATENVAKLRKRYPNGFSHAASAARVDVAGDKP